MALSITKLAEKARGELSKATGLDFSSILGVGRENSSWKVTLEMVEKHSIPDQMDILGIYEVLLDEEGHLIEFNRRGLRKRMDIESV